MKVLEHDEEGRGPMDRLTVATLPVFCGPQSSKTEGWVRFRDPQAAAYAADGTYRATGAPAAAVARGERESLGLASAMLTTWSDRGRVLAITSGDCGEAAAAALRTVTDAQLTADSTEAAGRAMADAASVLAETGPVHLALDEEVDVAALLRDWQPAVVAPDPVKAEAAGIVRELARALRGFRRPLVLLGAGAAGAVAPDELASLARALDCPVVLTSSATCAPAATLHGLRSAFAAKAPLIPAGSLPWTKAIASADGILALGSALSETEWLGMSQAKLARGRIVCVDRRRHDVEVADVFVQMEAGQCVRGLLEELGERGGEMPRIKRWTGICESWATRTAQEAQRCSSAVPIEPRFAVHEIVRAAGPETIFTAEGGAGGMWLHASLWLAPFVFPVQNATLGTPVPHAAAASLAFPERPVWGVIGDGAFFYGAPELRTLAELGLPVVFFVFNDASWSAIRLGQTFIYGGRYPGTDVPPTDYARLAENFGCEGVAVRTPAELHGALDRAAAHRSGPPLVIDVSIVKDHVPYAGANFMAAELDGALGSCAAQLAVGGAKGLATGRVKFGTVRSLVRAGS